MLLSNYYLKVDNSLKGNTVAMTLLAKITNFKYLTKNLVDALIEAGFLAELTSEEQSDVLAYQHNGYRVPLHTGSNSQNTLLTDYPFIKYLFAKALLEEGELTRLELNTLYKLGYVVAA